MCYREGWQIFFLCSMHMFPVTFLSTYPTQTDQDWKVEDLADSFMMKSLRSSWGKVTWKGKAGSVEAVGPRQETALLPLTMHENFHVWQTNKDLVNEPAHTWVQSCFAVWRVRWGQRSQPADAGEARRAGSQDGRTQTLIRETHHTVFSCFYRHTTNHSHWWTPFIKFILPTRGKETSYNVTIMFTAKKLPNVGSPPPSKCFTLKNTPHKDDEWCVAVSSLHLCVRLCTR